MFGLTRNDVLLLKFKLLKCEFHHFVVQKEDWSMRPYLQKHATVLTLSYSFFDMYSSK